MESQVGVTPIDLDPPPPMVVAAVPMQVEPAAQAPAPAPTEVIEIDDDEGGLRWGSKLRCLGARPWAEVEAERAQEKAALAEEEARKGGG